MSALTSTTLEAAELEEAEDLLRRSGAPATIRPAGGGGGFRFDAEMESDGELTLARYDLEGAWALHAQADRFVVTRSDSAALRWEMGGDRGSMADAPTQFAPGPNVVHLDGATEVFEFQFTPRALHRLAAEAYGVEHVRLGAGLGTPRDSAHAQYWGVVMQYTRKLFEGGLLRNDHLRAALKSNLAVTLLEGFALVDGTREWRLSSAGALAAFRRAVAFIDSAASLPISALDVAKEVGLPLRLLDGYFRTQTGGSITDHLLRVRVAGAHTLLMRSAPSTAAAEVVVRGWGFTSLDTYLSLHRRQYPGRPLPFEPV